MKSNAFEFHNDTANFIIESEISVIDTFSNKFTKIINGDTGEKITLIE